MSGSGPVMRFLYGTVPGRALMDIIQKTRAERVFVSFLRSGLSRPLIPYYARANHIPLAKNHGFRTYRDFFLRPRAPRETDKTPNHLVSPCDGWLSVFPVGENSSFAIKNSRYRVADLLYDETLAERFRGGTCMIFRLCASDYHHYSYIDDGKQGVNHTIPGILHSKTLVTLNAEAKVDLEKVFG